MKRLTALSLAVLAIGCDSGTEPDADPTIAEVAGAYQAVELTTTTNGADTDQLAAGASLEITLFEDGTTTGSLFVPEGDEDGSDFTADLSGTWSLDGSTVTFDHAADAFVRDMPFEYEGGRLTGDATFGTTRVRVLLAGSD